MITIIEIQYNPMLQDIVLVHLSYDTFTTIEYANGRLKNCFISELDKLLEWYTLIDWYKVGGKK